MLAEKIDVVNKKDMELVLKIRLFSIYFTNITASEWLNGSFVHMIIQSISAIIIIASHYCAIHPAMLYCILATMTEPCLHLCCCVKC